MMADAALELASRGFSLLPAHTAVAGECSCGNSSCSSHGKHPMIVGWLERATADPRQISQWWRRWPGANVGVRTGHGLVVIDIDPRNGGSRSFEFLEDELGPLPSTVSVLTGSGGKHLYFKTPTRFYVAAHRCWGLAWTFVPKKVLS